MKDLHSKKAAGKILYDLTMDFGHRLHPILLQMLKVDRDADPPFIGGRVVEYAFVICNLDLTTPGKVLDVGCTDPYNCIPATLASQRHEVFGLDLREFKLKYPNFTFYTGDIRRTEFASEFFDRIISVSTIEHIGVSRRYGSDEDPAGDRKAILQMLRILKPDGKILITLPYGSSKLSRPWERVYDNKKLNELVRGLAIEKALFYKINNDGYWEKVREEEASSSKGRGEDAAVACLKLSKMNQDQPFFLKS